MTGLTVWIDDTPVEVAPGRTVLQAVRAMGRDLPTLCHSDLLPARGDCRLCLVEGPDGRVVTACHTLVVEGGRYRTQTREIVHLRRQFLGFILQNHALDCDPCPARNRCRLRQVVTMVGLDGDFMPRVHAMPRVDRSHPLIHMDLSRCIGCQCCVEVCSGIQGADVLGLVGRGDQRQLLPASGRGMLAAGCVSCGLCVSACPTGALLEADEQARLVPDKSVTTTCGYCAVGCQLTLAVKNNRVIRVTPLVTGTANHGHACVKGRFGQVFASSPERLTHPLIRRPDGALRRAGWDEALELVANRLLQVRPQGPLAYGLIASSRCTNEENYLFQKFARVAMASNSVDNCARVCHTPSAYALASSLGLPAATNPFEDLEQAAVILLVGANPTEAHPVLGARILQAVRRGASLIVLDPRQTALARVATCHLALRPGSNIAVINALQWVILEEGLGHEDFIASRAEGLDALRLSLAGCSPDWAARHSGLDPVAIRRAARLYAGGRPSQILWGLGVTETCNGSLAAFGLINLAILCGQLGVAGGGANPIRGQNNVQGACDMGSLPHVFSDYRPVQDPVARQEHLAVWGSLPPATPGLRIPEMLEAARQGRLQALHVIGQDPALSDPRTLAVEEALAHVPFLVVQDIFPSATSNFAHVVLPAASCLEKEGSFVNSDRRIQRVRQVLKPPGEARSDGEIIHQLARHMGVDLGCGTRPAGRWDPAAAMTEIARLSPNWRGVSHARLEALGMLQWPVPDSHHPGTPRLYQGGTFPRGRARLTPTPWRGPAETVDDTYPFLLVTGRTLLHYNVASMTRRTPLVFLQGGMRESLRMHPQDAHRLGLTEGDLVRVCSSHGEVVVNLTCHDQVQPGLLFLSFHFPDVRTNRLIGGHADPYTLCPEYKTTPVRVLPLAAARNDEF